MPSFRLRSVSWESRIRGAAEALLRGNEGIYFGDESGVGTDSQVVVVNITSSDTGSGTDDRVLTVARTQTETGSGVDNRTLTVARTQTDTGSGADSQSVVIPVPKTSSDTGSGSDAQSLYITLNKTSSDTGSGSDNSLLLVFIIDTDIGGGASETEAAPTVLIVTVDVGSDLAFTMDVNEALTLINNEPLMPILVNGLLIGYVTDAFVAGDESSLTFEMLTADAEVTDDGDDDEVVYTLTPDVPYSFSTDLETAAGLVGAFGFPAEITANTVKLGEVTMSLVTDDDTSLSITSLFDHAEVFS